MTQNDAYDENVKNLIRQGWVTFRTIVPGFNHRIQQFRRGAKQNKKNYFDEKLFRDFCWFGLLIELPVKS